MRRLLLSAAILALPGCTQIQSAPAVVDHPSRDWRSVVTVSDRDRLRDWRSAFVDGLRSARAGGHSADIAREGALLDPDAALGGGPIPNGNYRCRVIKLGAKSAGFLSYISYPAFDCLIRQDGDVQDFAKLTGSQRQVGSVFQGDSLRQVFLGTLVLGDETRAMSYGRDTQRDVAGYVERIGPDRWRLIMPRPHFESQMDVMELVPSSSGLR
jgi:hypothetical protein